MAKPIDQNLWSETAAPAPATAPLAGAVDADVAIIGGGYTGLSTALFLAESGARVVVLEGDDIGNGCSGRNTGHGTPMFSHRSLEDVIGLHGPEWGERMIALQLDGGRLARELIERNGIDCALRVNGAIVAAHNAEKVDGLGQLVAQYRARDIPLEMLDAAETSRRTGSDRFHGAIFHPEAFQLNPMGYARGLASAALARGARIFTRSPVTALDRDGGGWRLSTPGGTVRAQQVVAATGAYVHSILPELKASFIPFAGLGLASAPIAAERRKTILPQGSQLIDTRPEPTGWRFDVDGRLVTAVMAPRGERSDKAGLRRLTARRLAHLFPDLGPVEWMHQWFGTVDLRHDSTPRIFELGTGLFAMLGFSGRGVPTCAGVGRELARLTSGTDRSDLLMRVEQRSDVPLSFRAFASALPIARVGENISLIFQKFLKG